MKIFNTTIKLFFPASRGLFSVVFAELMGARKRHLCPGSKRTVLGIHFSYLATEPSCDYMGSPNDSGVTVNECTRQWAQVMVSKQYREHAFGRRRPRLWTVVGSKSVSEVSFPCTGQFSEYNGKEAYASRERLFCRI